MRRIIAGGLIGVMALAPGGPATGIQWTGASTAVHAAQTLPSSPVTDEELWREMNGRLEDEVWRRLERATEQAWGRPVERDKVESVFRLVDASAAGDWRAVGGELTDQALDALPRRLNWFVWGAEKAHGVFDHQITQWARELYDHPSYTRLEAMVREEYERRRPRSVYDVNIGDDTLAPDQPFMPSYRLRPSPPRGWGQPPGDREAMLALEQQMFERWIAHPDAADLQYGGGAQAWDEGGAIGLARQSYPARLRQILGRVPSDREIFNHFYHRITQPNLTEYAETFVMVRRQQARLQARIDRQDAIDAYRRLREQEPEILAEEDDPPPPPLRPCPPSSLAAGHVGSGGDHSAGIASLQQMTDMARGALIAEGVDPGQIPFFPPNRPIGGLFRDEVQVGAVDLPAFQGGRFNGEIVLILPPDTTRAHFSGRPESITGSLRTADVPVGQAIAAVAPAYFNARFRNAWLSQNGAQAATQPLTIELIGPRYRYRYGQGVIRVSMISMLDLGVSICVNGERVIDRVYESGEISERVAGLGMSEAAHAGPHAVTLNNAIVAILEQAMLDLARTPGFEGALTANERRAAAEAEAERRREARAEQERRDRERRERERAEREQAERDRAERQRAEQERREREASANRLSPAETFALIEMLVQRRDAGDITQAQYETMRDRILRDAQD